MLRSSANDASACVAVSIIICAIAVARATFPHAARVRHGEHLNPNLRERSRERALVDNYQYTNIILWSVLSLGLGAHAPKWEGSSTMRNYSTTRRTRALS